MKYLFDHAKLPKDHRLLRDVNSAAERLAQKLEALHIEKSGLSEYCARVLRDKREVLTAYLQIYTYVLSWGISSSKTPYSKLTVLEYGGGIGLISMLAKELGVGTVIYNDIYDVSHVGAQHLAGLLGLRAEHYVLGDVDDVIGYSESRKLHLDAVVSFDVIEHIYDIDAFLTRLASFPGPRLKIVMASGANMYSPPCAKKIMAFQRQCELQGREATFGFYDRDALRPYVEIRREIIRRACSTLTPQEVETLATRTRGMREDDIVRAVTKYREQRVLPKELPHPTNTCDPYTGNWQEHLMEPSELVGVLSRAGFHADWFSGYFSGRHGSIVRRAFAKVGNAVIGLLDKRAIRLGKFYTLYAVKDQSR